jgi:cobalamin-dependent methionine synthase I
VQDWADQKKAEAKATVDSWKANHEAKKLARRADRAEEYAAAVVQVAVASIDEAEQAVFEAISARLNAEAIPVG